MTFYVLASISNAIILIISFSLLVSNTILILYNETTIERLTLNEFHAGDDSYRNIFEKDLLRVDDNFNIRDRRLFNPYFLGYIENVREVFGDNYYEWIMPYFTSRGDGIYFRTQSIQP
ncbi:putative DHHC-type Zn-finger protein [Trachipleistophora hominis]|uniref:Putative DHHC-type Zn-finger protein n=1 Tax=Trachipleistophora hominis TaxID=72359 RepID=L7JZ28_TRAHO|nr:putative DHHC-type Zn-finger protein [Trachipleistophora hominis]